MSPRSFLWLAVLLLVAPSTWAQSTSPVVTRGDDVTRVSVLADSASPCRAAISPVDRAWIRAWSRLTAATVAASGGPVVIWSGSHHPFGIAASQVVSPTQDAPSRRPKAVEYSRAYEVRARIHRYASIATLPLFATEFALGQSLYNNPGEGKKGAHAVVAAGIAGLFAANSVTGVWNLRDGWRDTNGRGRRLLHGLLMLVADAGFVATAALAPEGEGEREFGEVRRIGGHSKATHRAVAIGSMGIATVSYLTMVLWGR